jgi:hypothetical protein
MFVFIHKSFAAALKVEAQARNGCHDVEHSQPPT